MVRSNRSIDELYKAARTGERRALGRLLSHVERGGANADLISELAHPDAGKAHIVGITGAPGAGKSTLVGQLVVDLVASGRTPAVLAVDPSSPLTGGAILGDRIRMDDTLEPGSDRKTAFIRSMATRGHSGGLALAVPLAVRLFDACGYDPVIIETVGVGQVEVDVVGAADSAVVVVTPGMGDAVQANKAGLLEVADVFVVNKADRPGANDVRRNLDLMLDLSHMTGQEAASGYRPPILMTSALNGDGSNEVWSAVEKHRAHLEETGERITRRRNRVRAEVAARLAQAMSSAANVLLDGEGAEQLERAEAAEISPNQATNELLSHLLKDHRP
ncbi:MAG: LAO/AO transport system kinase [Verrucomicrobiales bacterium]|jgi:LAO/AO transport system kinase